jgi:hypothetical protein
LLQTNGYRDVDTCLKLRCWRRWKDSYVPKDKESLIIAYFNVRRSGPSVCLVAAAELRSRRHHAAVTAYCYCCGSGREVCLTTLNICIILVRLQVIIGVSVKITVFWVVKPYCLAEVYQRFGGPSCRNLQCRTFIRESGSTCSMFILNTKIEFYPGNSRDWFLRSVGIVMGLPIYTASYCTVP